MTVVYIDSVFALNALADYLLVYAAAQLAGARLRRGRFLLAALLGGAYAAAVFLPGLGWLSLLPVKLSAGVLMALAAFGGEPRFLRLTLLLFAAACGFAAGGGLRSKPLRRKCGRAVVRGFCLRQSEREKQTQERSTAWSGQSSRSVR